MKSMSSTWENLINTTGTGRVKEAFFSCKIFITNALFDFSEPKPGSVVLTFVGYRTSRGSTI